MLPELPTEPRPALKPPPNVPPVFAIVLAVLVIVGIGGTVFALGHRAHASGVAVGTAPTVTTTTTDPTTPPPASGTPTPLPTPSPAATTVALHPDIRVTQNQDMRPLCVNNTAPYTVVLANEGDVAANWSVVVPPFPNTSYSAVVTNDAHVAQHPLLTPRSSAPYWATVTPGSGSLAPGHTASFVVNPQTAMPCGGTSGTINRASVHLSFPSGASQADIPLTYAGTGPVAMSNVVLVSGNLSITQPCPTGGAMPASFTFALKNIGNGIAYPYIVVTNDALIGGDWAGVATTGAPTPPVSTWFYPGETLTVTITPTARVQCGATYYVYEHINNTQGVQSTMTFSDTFK